MKYYLGLGSNKDDRLENLFQCHAALNKAGIRILKYSSIYETQPVGVSNQPWFFNQVVKVDTEIEPDELLITLKKIEQNMGRDLSAPDEPRLMDIDILLADNQVVHTDSLQIPHPKLEKRNFVLIPFAEIAPNARHPVLKQEIKALLKDAQDRSQVRVHLLYR